MVRTLVAWGLVVFFLSVATECGSRRQYSTSPAPGNEAAYWKEKYEAERRENENEDRNEFLKAFGEGMNRWNRSMDRNIDSLESMRRNLDSWLK